MRYKYSNLKLSGDVLNQYDIDGESGGLNNLSSINIFIGENNAGKSRFMRELAKMKPSNYGIDGIDLNELKVEYAKFEEALQPAWSQLLANVSTGSVQGIGQVNFKDIDLSTYLSDEISDSFFEEKERNPKSLLRFLVSIRDNGIDNVSYYIGRQYYNAAIENIQSELKKEYSDQFLNTLKDFALDKIEFDKYYIPTLRSLNNFSSYKKDASLDMFEERVRTIYELDKDSSLNIFTGQTIYERIKSMLLGTREERERIAAYESFLSEKLFSNKEIVIIPRDDDDVVYVGIDGKEMPIYNLGDGIQSLIILTFPLFESERGLFFIEEPEMNMHPGMQRKFLQALQANPQHQYFITSHSNHLLDLTIDYSNISIYSFRIEGGTHKVATVTVGDKNVLELLGARATSVFLANKSIWVEGITDRLYIQKYLSLYLEEHQDLAKPREDIDYIFIEYGGNNITHWSFLDASSEDKTIDVDRITSKLLLISDQDGDSKEARKIELAEKLGDRYIVLDVKEIENTLSLDVLAKIVQKYEKIDELDTSTVDESTLKSTGIGTYIESTLAPGAGITLKRTGGYADASGTIKNKLAFCHKAIELLTYENMSDSARDLAEKIYHFTTLE